ncbi:MAG: hypothetical protein WDN72_03325 [Alphaproteobacteria bacterium]
MVVQGVQASHRKTDAGDDGAAFQDVNAFDGVPRRRKRRQAGMCFFGPAIELRKMTVEYALKLGALCSMLPKHLIVLAHELVYIEVGMSHISRIISKSAPVDCYGLKEIIEGNKPGTGRRMWIAAPAIVFSKA